MNQSTFSAAEDFVDVMKMYTNAVFVGNNTGGTSGQPLCEALESGGFFRICTRRCIAQNGEDIYNKGFAPDFRIILSDADLAAGRDIVLEKGTVHYGLLPVYLLYTKWDEQRFLFAVNGQTGKVVGNLPVSAGKAVGRFFMKFLLSLLFGGPIVACIVAYFFN